VRAFLTTRETSGLLSFSFRRFKRAELLFNSIERNGDIGAPQVRPCTHKSKFKSPA
jgi:hypothetical protein